MAQEITPGLLVLHGNRLEDLRQVVFDWCERHPLAPLEEALFLVQSNGIAEWLKLALAQDAGICAATRVELPARFLWRAYRQMLGRDAVPRTAPFDKTPLTWRLMRLLPGLLGQVDFAPLQRFLADGDALRRFQLAERLADLFDQYQVYRADWLEDWAAGRDVLRRADGVAADLADDQRWQSALWRAVLADVPQDARASSRATIHRRFVAELEAGSAPVQALPRRVVLFGAGALPLQTLEALAALARHCQVILAVPNPCRFHWADIIDGRELLRAEQRRHRLRNDLELAALPLEDLHAHSHPLLAGWGRQGRDFIRLLDQFDDAASAQERFDIARIDLFDDAPGSTLLQQVQARIRDLEPLAPELRPAIDAADRSIVFHIAHSPLREVEILHDQLLDLLSDGEITPRDIVVMVPEIESFAPAIHAVFGQYPTNAARHIPYTIADQRSQQVNPLLVALEWLLALPEQRCAASELRDLLDVPALARRFGLNDDDLPRLAQWIEGAGVRWGLSAQHRSALGLAACGEQNSWLFGLSRMLLGYANGDDGPFAGIEPFDEIGGLDAALVGSLAALVAVLQHWQTLLARPATAAEWGERLRGLLQAFFVTTNERDQLTLAALENALQNWQQSCADAGFVEPVALAVVRAAWLSLLDEPNLTRRFLGGGVTFCTLMPMRAIPFDVVCLLGMNDGDYPRRASRADFDLLALPCMARPGDRSRRDDDRYLMLEALLAARRTLYISWRGRNPRDNSAEPPSVLVSQLRDYLAAGWADGLLEARTTEHPLQPFSRRYFEGGELFTHAQEWRAAHAANDVDSCQLQHARAKPDRFDPSLQSAASSVSSPLSPLSPAGERASLALVSPGSAELPPFAPEPGFRLTLALLADFLKNPVRHFFRYRLDVVFAERDTAADDDEPFALNKLDEYALVSRFLDAARGDDAGDDIGARIGQLADGIARAGELPLGPFGVRERQHLVEIIAPVWHEWRTQQQAWPQAGGKEVLLFSHGDLQLEDWLDGLRQNAGERAWLRLDPTVFVNKRQALRADKLIGAWVQQLAASACGLAVGGVIVGRDAVLHLGAIEQGAAQAALRELIDAWRAGMQAPLPLACQAALARLEERGNPRQVYEGGFNSVGEVGRDPALARLYPDYAALTADGRFDALTERLFLPLKTWLDQQVTFDIHDATAQDDEEGGDGPDA
ncbi:MAG: exodeoxyribonuclease V subunit gamma [Rudaea sp.]|nr:exodeoxyribonuclease V subunit gamma [Rudaea sp.]